jgi:hypothetical protein
MKEIGIYEAMPRRPKIIVMEWPQTTNMLLGVLSALGTRRQQNRLTQMATTMPAGRNHNEKDCFALHSWINGLHIRPV